MTSMRLYNPTLTRFTRDVILRVDTKDESSPCFGGHQRNIRRTKWITIIILKKPTLQTHIRPFIFHSRET